MKQNLKAVKAWKLLVLALELSSLHIESAYRDGVTRRETQIVKYVSRDSLEIPRREHDPENQEIEATSERTTADSRSSCFRYLAITITALMLSRHLFAAITSGTEDYPFTLATMLFLRACGILFPMYVVFRTLAAIHKSIRCQYPDSDDDDDDEEEDYNSNSEGDEQQHLGKSEEQMRSLSMEGLKFQVELNHQTDSYAFTFKTNHITRITYQQPLPFVA
ncbi:hypothetical protein D5086_005298 [Populus alba]|uniref:Uncharacterized protein n=1 Tax=Populus alba TaxID=43335 RepID=A0ACC4CUY3_POPAL